MPVLEPRHLHGRDRNAEIVVGSDLAAVDGEGRMVEQRVECPFARLLMILPLVRKLDAKAGRGVEFSRGQRSRRVGERQLLRQGVARQHRHPVERVQISSGLVLKRILEGDELVALALQLLEYLVSLNHIPIPTHPHGFNNIITYSQIQWLAIIASLW